MTVPELKPDYWTYTLNGEFRGISDNEPPSDSYDDGSLVALYAMKQQESGDVVGDLAMLVRRLARKVELNNPDLAGKAMDYLKRKGLQGSPLRGSGT